MKSANSPAARRMGRPRKNDRPNGKSARDRILDAAEELFARHGFDATTVDAIAAHADLTVGALYRHFSAKGELLLDVVRRALTSLPSARHMRGDSGRADLLPAMVELYMAPASRRLRRIVIELHTAASRDRRVARLLREFSERMALDTRTRIAIGRAEGMLEGKHDADLAGRLLMVLIAGLAHVDTLYPSLLGNPDWRKLVQETVATLLGMKQPHTKTKRLTDHGPKPNRN
ncbi:MAG: TetR/AcrR family transcriptional regulator [Candidatus Binataceae bacterium]